MKDMKKNKKLSESGYVGLIDEQDLKGSEKKILKSTNLVNPASDNMKQGWEIKTIGDVCKVIAGQSPEGKFYNDNGNGLPFY